jgi:hypothetical protein
MYPKHPQTNPYTQKKNQKSLIQKWQWQSGSVRVEHNRSRAVQRVVPLLQSAGHLVNGGLDVAV